MTLIQPSRSLKAACTVDAAAGAGMAALQLALPRLLADQLGLPMALLLETGLFLLGFVALLAFLARSARVPTALVHIVVVGNVAWAAASVLIWATGLVTPTPLGTAYVLLQAAAVLALATWEAIGLKASRPVAAASAAAAH